MTTHASNPVRQRNIALDFFRGLALLIILINHMPNNIWSEYTPTHFGFSDSAEIFVFISGYVAALVYSNSFRKVGITLASLQVLRRCATIYAAHIGMFVLLCFLCVLGNEWQDTINYITRLNLQYFFNQTPRALFSFITLHYVPNYFDILPMYLVVMLWIPVVMALARVHKVLALLFCLALYAGSIFGGLCFGAEPFSERPWYFNPYAWQLMFFTGFSFGAGWLTLPRNSRALTAMAVIMVVGAIPFAGDRIWIDNSSDAFKSVIIPLLDKTNIGPLRILHFLALAWLARQLVHAVPAMMDNRFARAVAGMGQSALPNFVLSMTLSQIGGAIIDQSGPHWWGFAIANIGCIAIMFCLHHGHRWIASQPWKNHQAPALAGWMDAVPGWSAIMQPGLRLALLLLLALIPLMALHQPGQHNVLSMLSTPALIDDAITGTFGDNDANLCTNDDAGTCQDGEINLDRL